MNDVNSVHIEYIREKIDELSNKMDSHIREEMHDFRTVRSDVNQIKVDMALMRENHKSHTNFRTTVIAAVGAGMALMFETMARKLFP